MIPCDNIILRRRSSGLRYYNNKSHVLGLCICDAIIHGIQDALFGCRVVREFWIGFSFIVFSLLSIFINHIYSWKNGKRDHIQKKLPQKHIDFFPLLPWAKSRDCCVSFLTFRASAGSACIWGIEIRDNAITKWNSAFIAWAKKNLYQKYYPELKRIWIRFFGASDVSFPSCLRLYAVVSTLRVAVQV